MCICIYKGMGMRIGKNNDPATKFCSAGAVFPSPLNIPKCERCRSRHRQGVYDVECDLIWILSRWITTVSITYSLLDSFQTPRQSSILDPHPPPHHLHLLAILLPLHPHHIPSDTTSPLSPFPSILNLRRIEGGQMKLILYDRVELLKLCFVTQSFW